MGWVHGDATFSTKKIAGLVKIKRGSWWLIPYFLGGGTLRFLLEIGWVGLGWGGLKLVKKTGFSFEVPGRQRC